MVDRGRPSSSVDHPAQGRAHLKDSPARLEVEGGEMFRDHV